MIDATVNTTETTEAEEEVWEEWPETARQTKSVAPIPAAFDITPVASPTPFDPETLVANIFASTSDAVGVAIDATTDAAAIALCTQDEYNFPIPKILRITPRHN